jgi:hypothetical protein
MTTLGKEVNKNVISTEGCFACDLTKPPKGQQQSPPGVNFIKHFSFVTDDEA